MAGVVVDVMGELHKAKAITLARQLGREGNSLGWHKKARLVKPLNDVLEGLSMTDPLRQSVYAAYEAGYVSAGGVM